MGALAPVSLWIPEDDLLLKNAVEAGASLESLAKGAVQFSQKFTIKDLQERWGLLLYDPSVSEEASIRMIEFKRSAPLVPLKPKAGNSKLNKSSPAKRKAESVRSCYYTLRRRIHNESFGPMDLDFIDPPESINYMDNADDPLSGSCMFRDPISNQFRLQDSKLDVMHGFPQTLTDNVVGVGNGGATNIQNPVEGNFVMEQDTTSLHQERTENRMYSADDSNMRRMLQIPAYEQLNNGTQDMCSEEDFLVEQDTTMHEEWPEHGMYNGENSMEQLSTYEEINNGAQNLCSEFEGNQTFDSPLPECNESFHNLVYSSPLHDMPIWSTDEGISAAEEIHIDVGGTEKDMHAGDAFPLPDVLTELSNSLMNFTNDEELLFVNVDGKDAIDIAGLSSLLLSSSADVNQHPMPDGTEQEALENSNCIAECTDQHGVCSGEMNESRGLYCGDNDISDVSEVHLQSTVSVTDTHMNDILDEEIFCVLNTEDPEIPCNDNIIFPYSPRRSPISSTARSNALADSKKFGSTKLVSRNKRTNEVVSAQRDLKILGLPCKSSHIKEPQVTSRGSLPPVCDRAVKFELPNKSSNHIPLSCVDKPCGGSTQIDADDFIADTCLPTALKDSNTAFAKAKHCDKQSTGSFVEKPPLGSNNFKNCPLPNARGTQQDLDESLITQNHKDLHSNAVPRNMASTKHLVDPPPDLEEPDIESDGDVPYFSDIEAMILDMDLDPENLDLHSNDEVSRYQQEDALRMIIRLEQSAGSYMQRAITLHGAFAVLYGRQLKHFINKPQVLLGRGTEDNIVDVDLGREGRANKISRQQATICMDNGGSFHLKNLGKCSIYINGVEVVSGRSLGLSHSCLIEIREMSFIFEMNQTCVNNYLNTTTDTNQEALEGGG